MELVFLTGHAPMTKRFTAKGVDAAPQGKKLTSHHHEVKHYDLHALVALYRDYAAKGACLLKGTLTRPLENESRAGLGDTQLPRPTIILDFDGVPVDTLPPVLAAKDLTRIAERLIADLPETFHDVSYICRASSSMGTKANRASLHLEFPLALPVAPARIKAYLERLNFLSPTLDQLVSLTASGNALHFVLDPCLADNTRLVYLGTPVFEGRDDPIPNPEDRQFVVEKDEPAVDLIAAINAHKTPNLNTLKKDRVQDLRDAAGLPRKTFKTEVIRLQGRSTTVVTNPDHVPMTFATEYERSVAYNVGHGDSGAYFVFKDDPRIVHNWKGEPPFVFEAAAPEAYQAHIEQYGVAAVTGTDDAKPRPMPLVFRDLERNVIYNGLYDAANDAFDMLAPTSRQEIGDFMRDHSGFPPEVVPQWNLRFEPARHEVLNAEKRFVNLFNPPPLLKHPPPCPEGLEKHPALHMLEPLRQHCPNISTVLLHLMGDGERELNYFCNWLAFILQYRKKTRTAWLFHGTYGTGKGVLQEKILNPLFSEKYVHYMQLSNLEDEFNGWCEQTLIAMVDEFKLSDARNSNKLENKLKNWIHESTISIRQMRVNQYIAKNYINFLFFSNEHDPIKIRDKERRFNIAPKQPIPLEERFGVDPARAMVDAIAPELKTLAGLLLHATVDITAATKCLDNQAKRDLAEASADTVDVFVRAIKEGNLEYFERLMDNNIDDNKYQEAASNRVKSWVKQYNGRPMPIFADDFRPAYNVMVGPSENAEKFIRMLQVRGLETERVTINGKRRMGLHVTWDVTDDYIQGQRNKCLNQQIDHIDNVVTNLRPDMSH